jgi:hypothetical protein
MNRRTNRLPKLLTAATLACGLLLGSLPAAQAGGRTSAIRRELVQGLESRGVGAVQKVYFKSASSKTALSSPGRRQVTFRAQKSDGTWVTGTANAFVPGSGKAQYTKVENFSLDAAPRLPAVRSPGRTSAIRRGLAEGLAARGQGDVALVTFRSARNATPASNQGRRKVTFEALMSNGNLVTGSANAFPSKTGLGKYTAVENFELGIKK